MQTRALRTLLEIDRAGSFAGAAEAQNMTLSAVSMQMKALETELGAMLFDRAFRPPKLTPIGRAVTQEATRMIQAEAAMITACRPSDRLTGRFRVGFVPTASVRLLPSFLRNARHEAPDARFEIETGLSETLQDRVLSGHLDGAVLTASDASPPGLAYHILRKEPLVYAAPRDHAGQSPEALFRTLPFLHFLPQSGIGKLIAAHVAGPKRQAGTSIFLDSVEAIMECVDEGIGFTLLPAPDIARHVGRRGEVVTTEAPGLHRHLVYAHAVRGASDGAADQIVGLFDAEEMSLR